MATGLPAGQKLEIEFTPGVWTDVTADVDFAAAIPITRGRNSVASQPSVGSMVFQLVNGTDCQTGAGSYTPQRQVLADGVTPHPYWPNVLPRVRCRYSNTPAGTRAVMYVKGWPPQLETGIRALVTILAYDRLKYLSKVTLKSPIAQEVAQSAPVTQWSLTDAVGATSAIENLGHAPLTITAATGTALAFGDNGPGVGDGTGVKFAPSTASNGQYLQGSTALTLTAFTIEIYVNATTALPSWGTGAGGENILGFDDGLGNIAVLIWLLGGKPAYQDATGGSAIVAAASIADGGWHHIAVTRASLGGAVTLYVDGVSQGSSTGSYSSTNAATTVTVGESANPATYAAARFKGNVGYAAFYNAVLSATAIAGHGAARNGYSGDTTGTRISRYLPAAGLTSADWNLDAGKAVVGTYPQAGRTVLQACQDMAETEGGGAVVYAFPDGKIRFADRSFRKPGAPVLTIHGQQDLILPPYDPAFDDEALVNSSTVTRAAESGTLSTQTVTNAASINQYDPTTGDVTSYATTDTDALNLAQSRVAADANPGFRLPQAAVDLVTAQNSLYAALASLQIGSRIRITNLPVGYAPATQVDVIYEGLAETPSTDSYLAVFDLSPADNPARGVWEDASYGRWGGTGQTLNANISNAATTLAIATAGGQPTFTTVSARYPLKIQIGQEHIQLNSAPGGASSPQTFTGCTRGVDGTPAAAQTAGATITLAPAPTWAL